MSTAGLRRTRIWLPIAEFVLISLTLFPWISARASDGPQDGRMWSWNLLGWPVAPGSAGLLIWIAGVALVCGGTWLLISSRILGQLKPSSA